MALETRGTPFEICRFCIVPYIQNMGALGYDLGLGQLFVLRAKFGIGMEYDQGWKSVRGAWIAGFAAPIRLGKNNGLAALPFFEASRSFKDEGSLSSLAFRVGVGFDIGIGNISKVD